jgi:chemotaxis protein histidine kinase CheA
VPGVAGATILGDGRVALILDVNAITRTTSSNRTLRPAA